MLILPFRRTPARAALRVAVALAALTLSGCSIGWDCGVARTTTATGTVRDAANVALATVRTDLREDVPTRFWLGVGVSGSGGSAGAPLKGRVTRARLVTETGELLAEIPTGTSTLYLDVVVALNVELPSRAEYDRVRSALQTARTKVILETDLTGLEMLETTLTGVTDVPGEVGRCSPQ